MCRIVAFKSDIKMNTEPFLNYLAFISKYGYNYPHRDGYGYVLFDKLNSWIFRSLNCIYEEEKIDSKMANAGIFHSRKASTSNGYKPRFNHVHPFTGIANGINYAFIHNGTINDFSDYPGEIDTQKYFRILLSNLNNQSPEEALKSTSNFISERYKYTSLISVLTDYKDIWCVKKVYDEHDYKHDLFSIEFNNFKMITSEKVEEKFCYFDVNPLRCRRIPNGKVIKL
jgi:predicted glutamine amidotransferase